jgi:hypothetical protein
MAATGNGGTPEFPFHAGSLSVFPSANNQKRMGADSNIPCKFHCLDSD